MLTNLTLQQQHQFSTSTKFYSSNVGPEDYAGVQRKARGHVKKKSYRKKFFKAVCENNLRCVSALACEKKVNKYYSYEIQYPSGDFMKFSRTSLMMACKEGNTWLSPRNQIPD